MAWGHEEAEWAEKEQERKIIRDREQLLSQYRDELFDHAGKNHARRAYAQAWHDGSREAVLIRREGYADYGPDVDREALRALVRTGGTTVDIYEMAGRSPYVRLLRDAEAMGCHTMRVIARIRQEPEIAALLDEADVALADRLEAIRPRTSPVRQWARDVARDNPYEITEPALGSALAPARRDRARSEPGLER